jgi:SAM-dependent methyltransferase
MRIVPCHLCGSHDYRVMFAGSGPDTELTADHIGARKGSINKAYSHTWVRCACCNLVYANPVPDEEVFGRLYEVSDQGDYEREVDNLTHTYEKYLLKNAQLVSRKGMAVDIGAGNGFFLRVLLGFGFAEVRGVEPSRATCDSAAEDVRPFMINKMYDERDFEPGSVDFISCFQTLEHVYRPDELIASFARLLSKGGVVYAVAHDFEALGVRLLKEKHPIVNAAHLTLFDPCTLARMFGKHLEVLSVFRISNRYSLRYWISLLPLHKAAKDLALQGLSFFRMERIPLTLSLGNIGIVARRR